MPTVELWVITLQCFMVLQFPTLRSQWHLGTNLDNHWQLTLSYFTVIIQSQYFAMISQDYTGWIGLKPKLIWELQSRFKDFSTSVFFQSCFNTDNILLWSIWHIMAEIEWIELMLKFRITPQRWIWGRRTNIWSFSSPRYHDSVCSLQSP